MPATLINEADLPPGWRIQAVTEAQARFPRILAWKLDATRVLFVDPTTIFLKEPRSWFRNKYAAQKPQTPDGQRQDVYRYRCLPNLNLRTGIDTDAYQISQILGRQIFQCLSNRQGRKLHGLANRTQAVQGGIRSFG